MSHWLPCCFSQVSVHDAVHVLCMRQLLLVGAWLHRCALRSINRSLQTHGAVIAPILLCDMTHPHLLLVSVLMFWLRCLDQCLCTAHSRPLANPFTEDRGAGKLAADSRGNLDAQPHSSWKRCAVDARESHLTAATSRPVRCRPACT